MKHHSIINFILLSILAWGLEYCFCILVYFVFIVFKILVLRYNTTFIIKEKKLIDVANVS